MYCDNILVYAAEVVIEILCLNKKFEMFSTVKRYEQHRKLKTVHTTT